MPYRAKLNGQGDIACESMPPGYVAQAGETLFADPPTPAQIAALFPAEVAARDAAITAKFSQLAALNAAIAQSPLYIAGMAATSAQIDAYMANNANTLAKIPGVMAEIAKIVFRRERLS